MQVDDLFGPVQPQPGTAYRGRERIVDPGELMEQLVYIGRIDSDSFIRDGYTYHALPLQRLVRVQLPGWILQFCCNVR